MGPRQLSVTCRCSLKVITARRALYVYICVNSFKHKKYGSICLDDANWISIANMLQLLGIGDNAVHVIMVIIE